MTTAEALADLHRFILAQDGKDAPSRLVSTWLRTLIENGDQGAITPELLYAMIGRSFDWEVGEHSTQESLSTFLSRLAVLQPVSSVLDPTCGFGLLLHNVAVATGAQAVHGIDINAECCSLAKVLLGEKSVILNRDTLISSEGLLDRYDLIVAQPPFGLRMREHESQPYLGTKFRGEFGQALVAWSCARLSENGRAMLVLSPSYLWGAHAGVVHTAVQKHGCRVRALIHLPSGSMPHTRIDSYIIVFEKGVQKDVFIGELSDNAEHQDRLIDNYRRNRTGDQPALGRVCSLATFRGFDAFVAQERLKRLARTTGWDQHLGRSVIVAHNKVGSEPPDISRDSDSIFLRLTGKTVAVRNRTDISESALRDTVLIGINPNLADPRYMVHWFNESLIGQATIAASLIGAMPRIDLSALLDSAFFLPPLHDQRQILQGMECLNKIRGEVAELEKALLGGVDQASKVVQQILTINKEDRFEDWIETLPFPLASILWRYHAGGGSAREKYEVLLHFFEATAAFVATIHLSAYMADDTLWKSVVKGLVDNLAKARLSMERATFGTWKMIVEYLATSCRKLLNSVDGAETCFRIYGTPNRNHIAMLCHADLLSVLQRANSIRNSSIGHAGAIGPDEAQQIHDELLGLVHRVRGVFGRAWLDVELIQPSVSRFHDGVHLYKAKRLMGTRSTPFEVVERESLHPMESDRLYLFDAMSQKGQLLRPFIRVMPSPEKKANACFIFSRCEQSGSRFVSYHFEEESSLTGSFSDIDETFRRIHAFDEGASL